MRFAAVLVSAVVASACTCANSRDPGSFIRISVEQVHKSGLRSPAVGVDLQTGFVYARGLLFGDPQQPGTTLGRVAARLGWPPEQWRRGCQFHVQHGPDGRQFSVVLSAGWGLHFAAAPEDLVDGVPSRALEASLTSFERWLAAAEPREVSFEYIEDDDRVVRVGFRGGDIAEFLSFGETSAFLLRHARLEGPLHAPYASTYEAQVRMKAAMAPIWAWEALSADERKAENEYRQAIADWWEIQARALLTEWDSLSPGHADDPATIVRMGVPAAALREEGAALSFGDELLRSRLQRVESRLEALPAKP